MYSIGKSQVSPSSMEVKQSFFSNGGGLVLVIDKGQPASHGVIRGAGPKVESLTTEGKLSFPECERAVRKTVPD